MELTKQYLIVDTQANNENIKWKPPYAKATEDKPAPARAQKGGIFF